MTSKKRMSYASVFTIDFENSYAEAYLGLCQTIICGALRDLVLFAQF